MFTSVTKALAFEDYWQVFTPGSPISQVSRLYGRAQELLDLQRALSRPGHHPIVIGNRGVGKTSLVQLSLKEIESGAKIIRVGCNATMTFEDFSANVLRKIHDGPLIREVQTTRTKAVSAEASLFVAKTEVSGNESKVVTHDGPARQKAEPWGLFEAIRNYDKRIIIVVDEYDRIGTNTEQAKHFHENIADLMKTMADNSDECNSRLVIVGVSHSAKSLLGQHASIERSAREIYLRPLRKEDVHDFLAMAEQTLGFEFANDIKEDIASSSLGYPYFAHLVGLECLDVMTERDRSARIVEPGDYKWAISRAVDKAFRTELRKFTGAMGVLKLPEVRFIALLLRYKRTPTRATFEKHLAKRKIMDARDFNTVLNSLVLDKKILYVSRNSDELRFADPLMAPFLKKHPQICSATEPDDQNDLDDDGR